MQPRLKGKNGLIVGVANDGSLAAACARAAAQEGAALALTYRDARAAPFAAPVAEAVRAVIVAPMDAARDAEIDAVFDAIRAKWGRLDFLVHAIAFCNADDLHGRVIDCSREGFAEAMDLSCHSLLRLARRAEPLMTEGGSILTLSFAGAARVVEGYGVMGPVKAALEATVRYLAAELGPGGVRVNAISAGPMPTRAAAGLADIGGIIRRAEAQAPLPRLADADDVGALAAFLASDAAGAITGGVHYVDAGANIMNDAAGGA